MAICTAAVKRFPECLNLGAGREVYYLDMTKRLTDSVPIAVLGFICPRAAWREGASGFAVPSLQ